MDKQWVVIDKDDVRGVATFSADQVDADTPVWVEFDKDQQVQVSRSSLIKLHDDTYYLPLSLAQLADHFAEKGDREVLNKEREFLVIPVMEESVEFHKRVVETGKVQIRKLVEEAVQTVDTPLVEEKVEVRRVPVNQTLDQPASVRFEDNTLIVPLHKEVLVVERKLLLTEEIHIIKQPVETNHQEEVTLRQEKIIVERTQDKD